MCSDPGTSGGGEPSWDTTLGNPTTDGGVTWTAIIARAQADTVATEAGDRREFTGTIANGEADSYFTLGHVKFNTGNNAGLTREIKAWTNSSRTVKTFLTFPFDIAATDTFTIYAGCAKSRAACIVWDNIRNFRGFADVPHQDEAFRTPDMPG
jgi:uncharacterized phage protein (TIGR02218 family)